MSGNSILSEKCWGKCMPMHAFAKIQWYIFKKFRRAFYFPRHLKCIKGLGWSTRPGVPLHIGSYQAGNPGEHGACIGENAREKGLCVREKSGKCQGKRSWNFGRHPDQAKKFWNNMVTKYPEQNLHTKSKPVCKDFITQKLLQSYS